MALDLYGQIEYAIFYPWRYAKSECDRIESCGVGCAIHTPPFLKSTAMMVCGPTNHLETAAIHIDRNVACLGIPDVLDGEVYLDVGWVCKVLILISHKFRIKTRHTDQLHLDLRPELLWQIVCPIRRWRREFKSRNPDLLIMDVIIAFHKRLVHDLDAVLIQPYPCEPALALVRSREIVSLHGKIAIWDRFTKMKFFWVATCPFQIFLIVSRGDVCAQEDQYQKI